MILPGLYWQGYQLHQNKYCAKEGGKELWKLRHGEKQLIYIYIHTTYIYKYIYIYIHL